MSAVLQRQLLEQLARLDDDQQRQVLDYARSLDHTSVVGVPGHTLLSFFGRIPPDELEAMSRAIEADCEHVDSDEW